MTMQYTSEKDYCDLLLRIKMITIQGVDKQFIIEI